MTFDKEKQEALLRLMTLMMISDDEVHVREFDVIRMVYANMTGIELSDADLLDEVGEAREESGDAAAYASQIADRFNDLEKEIVIKAAFLVGLMDGRFRDPEEETLVDIATALGVSDERLRDIVAELLDVD